MSFPRVLVVDDDASIRFLTRVALEVEGEGEVVGEACDGRTALELVDTLHPDLIVLDLNMPGGGGDDLLVDLTSRNDRPRIVVWSAYPPDLVDAARHGADATVLKDGDTVSLRAAIKAVTVAA